MSSADVDTHSPPQREAPPFFEKWWTYQKERFPLAGHGVLIAAFSFCAVSLSRLLRGAEGFPPWEVIVVAFGTCFAFFLQLRIADEFKDFAEDSRFRPYRPVPRGLVTLRELGMLFAVAAAGQLALALWLDMRLVGLLAITWSYLALMSKEFFVGEWLRRRHVLYMTSHMLIMPLVDLYATSADWLPTAGRPPAGLWMFLAASYFNGLVIEIGRKIRAPEAEEAGVDTYSRLWGMRTATAAWLGAVLVTLVLAGLVARQLDAAAVVWSVLAAFFTGAVGVALWFARSRAPTRGKWIERYAGVWTIALYLALGMLTRLVNSG